MSKPAWLFRAAGWAAVAIGALSIAGCGGSNASGSGGGVTQNEYAYVACGFEVKQFHINGNGSLSALTPASVASWAPHAIVTTPNGQWVYTGNSNGEINQYHIEADGTLTPLSPATVATDPFPYALAVSPDGKFFYAGTLNNDKIAQYSIGVDGKLTPLVPAQVSVPTGVFRLLVSPNSSFMYVAGSTGIGVFNIGVDGKLTAHAPASYGSHSGEVRISPDGAFLYSGASDHVEQFSIGVDGSLTPLNPANVPTTANGIEAIGLSPDGKFAYVGNFAGGNPDSPVDQYSIGNDGTLSALNPTHVTCGNAPAQVTLEPTGSFLYIPNTNDGTVSIFKVNGNGKLTPASNPLLDTNGAEQIAFAVK